MSHAETVQIDDRVDRWRFTCPEGHRSWEPTNHHFWCAKCARDAPESEGTFQRLRDTRDDRLLAREDVRLLDEVGPYDRDLDRRGDQA
jgi:5-methylcytosine-specific restriction endonuclease McrA